MTIITDDPAARRARARRLATRLETDCLAQGGRPDLLLHAARNRFAAGEPDLARAQAEALLAWADEDPSYMPGWLAQQARDLLVQIDRGEDAGPPAGPVAPPR